MILIFWAESRCRFICWDCRMHRACFDITGTMLMVYWAFCFMGSKVVDSMVVAVFNQIFLMVYLSVWLRQEQCADGRQMDKDPFRAGRGATLAYYCVVCSAQRAGFLSYGFME